tara:strand:- start:251 stop:1138 length:888 start_codon:yes stop_codon:yes gene_type:complete
MNNKVLLFSAVGILLFFICKELQKQNSVLIPGVKLDKETVNNPILVNKTKENDRKKGNDFVFPAITTITQPLVKFINEILDPDLKEINGKPIKVIRNNILETKEKEANRSVEKITPGPGDIITPNPIDTSEYYYVGEDTSNAWSETNISQHPSYHTSNISNELTQSGGFFDANNQFHDQTSPSAKTHLPDRCFMSENNQVLCKFNNRLHNIPPKLIDNKKENKLLKSIGQGKGDIFKPISSNGVVNVNNNSYQVFNYDNEKTNNGGEFFNSVVASNESPSDYLVMDTLPKGNYSF